MFDPSDLFENIIKRGYSTYRYPLYHFININLQDNEGLTMLKESGWGGEC